MLSFDPIVLNFIDYNRNFRSIHALSVSVDVPISHFMIILSSHLRIFKAQFPFVFSRVLLQCSTLSRSSLSLSLCFRLFIIGIQT